MAAICRTAVLFLALVRFTLPRGDALPVGKMAVVPTNQQFSFMRRFGYLEDPQPGFEAQYSKETIRRAIMEIQRFGALPQTGVFDEDTIKLMKRKRCGVKDVIGRSRRYAIVGRGWRKLNITYTVNNWNAQLGERNVKEQVAQALGIWAKHANFTFSYVEGDRANIKFSFLVDEHGDKYPFDGPGGVLGHAFFPMTKHGGSVHFDDEENWDMSADYDSGTTGFFLVAVHELGHALGLGHSDVETAIMYPYHSDFAPEDLDKDDIEALNQLYSPYSVDIVDNSISKLGEGSSSVEREDTTRTTPELSTEPTKYTTGEKQHSSYNRSEEICNGFDTLAVLNRELYVFKGQDVWRFTKRGVLNSGYPKKIHREFLDLDVKRIDAVYQRKDGSIIFFSGFNYWSHSTRGMSGPFAITDHYQLPAKTAVDAAFLWSTNNRTYLFKDDIFWRYDEDARSLDEDYPRHMDRWRGVPTNIKAAIDWKDDETYFFKDLVFWKFNNVLVKADRSRTLPTPQMWFGCPETEEIFQKLSVYSN